MFVWQFAQTKRKRSSSRPTPLYSYGESNTAISGGGAARPCNAWRSAPTNRFAVQSKKTERFRLRVIVCPLNVPFSRTPRPNPATNAVHVTVPRLMWLHLKGNVIQVVGGELNYSILQRELEVISMNLLVLCAWDAPSWTITTRHFDNSPTCQRLPNEHRH